jgi:hypothetical protein
MDLQTILKILKTPDLNIIRDVIILNFISDRYHEIFEMFDLEFKYDDESLSIEIIPTPDNEYFILGCIMDEDYSNKDFSTISLDIKFLKDLNKFGKKIQSVLRKSKILSKDEIVELYIFKQKGY